MVIRTAFADLLQVPKIQALWSDVGGNGLGLQRGGRAEGER